MEINNPNQSIKSETRPVEYLTRQKAADYLRISVRLLDQKAAVGEIAY